MKQSPRAWLLARHQTATPTLDASRRTAIEAALRDNAPVPTSQLLRALFLPQHRLWTTLAATWTILLALHLLRPDSNTDSLTPNAPQLASSPLATSPESSPDRLATSTSFADRQAQLHALLR